MAKKKNKGALALLILIATAVVIITATLIFSLDFEDKSFEKTVEKAYGKSGIVYRTDKFVDASDNSVYPVRDGDMYYFKLEYNGKSLDLTESVYDDARIASEYNSDGCRNWYAAACKSGKWGYIRFYENSDNTEVLSENLTDFIYENAEPFCSGLAAVCAGGKYGFIDTSGAEVLKCIYDNVKFYSENLIPVCRDGQWTYINMYGKQTVSGIFEEAESFERGCAAVKVKGCWGYIDTDGNYLVEPQYDDAWAVRNDGTAYVCEGDVWKKITVRG